jgi:hypothetical protein
MNKKQFRKDIETKLDNALGHLAKDADKKFRKIVKKASQLFTDVLHTPKPKSVKEIKIKSKSDKKITKTVPAKTDSTKTVPTKKAPKKVIKKAAVKKKLKP